MKLYSLFFSLQSEGICRRRLGIRMKWVFLGEVGNLEESRIL